jgi:hypothetical protein
MGLLSRRLLLQGCWLLRQLLNCGLLLLLRRQRLRLRLRVQPPL